MAILASVALTLLAQTAATQATEAPQSEPDVGYEELIDGRDAAAVEVIEGSVDANSDDPARLINLGIALARMGQFEEARANFEAARKETSIELETSNGEWVDSRRLARQALTMLDRGEFARYYALSMR